MGSSKNNRNKKGNTKKTGKSKKQSQGENFWSITGRTLREATIWIFSVVIITGLYALIMGNPLLFTIHRSLYMIGMALGIYAILESIIKKNRNLKEEKAKKEEAERVRKQRNIGIYRGFMVMGAAFILEIIDYVIQ
ncbi:hypothetical protein [Isachenkonia alkalipeptolytica]|uniref:Uncharacterized protein n=1 Tax=Isachenkonia alkalipeptolytica TaxID=2565777 RepID=A0AA44BCH5_9CLOT|nr:hypothetical protein [Isachenkonia alkalipeptolytica]NBG87374.1 hypothetical protein [Isachenkonia alkalipeptolytica]